MAEKCDGVIVGSAIVKLCGQYGKDCVPYVEKYVKSHKGCNPGVKNDHQFKKRKPSVKEPFILSQTVFFFWLQKPCSVVNALGWW